MVLSGTSACGFQNSLRSEFTSRGHGCKIRRTMSLNMYRRHTPSCRHGHKGREFFNCHCPIWCDGVLHGKRYGRSLKTRGKQRAIKRLATLESPDAPIFKPIPEAIQRWEGQLELEESSRLRYQRILRRLESFCGAEGSETTNELGLEELESFRAGRINPRTGQKIARTTSARELQVLRQFLAF